MTKLCLPIAAKKSADVVAQAAKAKQAGADLVEIWLGELEDLEIPELFAQVELPILANCKGADEKGSFGGSEQEKVDLLITAAQAGAAYVDIDHATEPKLLTRLHEGKGTAELILSAHYFAGTPGLPHLTAQLATMLQHTPDVVKFAATPQSLKDVVTILRLAEKLMSKSIRHITISMGQQGKVTRVAAPVFGSEVMFATLDEAAATAPGQLSLNQLANIYQLW